MTERDTAASFLGQLRVVVVAGIAAGVVLVGVGSRLAMLLLRLTSPDEVRGVTSDDGFTIGEVTLFGTYNLLNLGAAVGLIGAFAYWLVAPWLIGPRWFRRFTTGLAAGAVAGSMLIHADGVDFTALQPMWLAIGLFVALPAMFGSMIGVAVDVVADEESWINRGRRRSILPFVLPVLFPVSIFVLLVVTLALLVCWKLRALPIVQRLSVAKPYGLAVRSTFLLIAALGLWALVGDIQALA